MCIHGDKSQQERDWVLNGKFYYAFICILCIYALIPIPKLLHFCFSFSSEFRTGKAPILVATDVAARGLGKVKVWLVVFPLLSLSINSKVVSI